MKRATKINMPIDGISLFLTLKVAGKNNKNDLSPMDRFIQFSCFSLHIIIFFSIKFNNFLMT